MAKEITEVNSIGSAKAQEDSQSQLRLSRQPVYPSYTVDQVLVTARRLYEFVTADQQEEKAAT